LLPVTDPYLPTRPPAPPPTPSASPEAPGRPWGPSRALLGIVILILAASVEVSIIAVVGDPMSLAGKLVLQAMLAATLIGVAFALAGSAGEAVSPAALGLRRPSGSPIRDALIGYGAYFAFVIVYASFVHPHQKDLTRSLGFGHGPVVSIIVATLIVVAAPVSEEVFFRGFLFGGLRRTLPFVAAALLSAAIFGAFHYTGPGSLTVLPQLAALGVVLAWVYERSGSIYPTIALHILNNGLAFAVLTS
jgi:membrane protease YdiL (CAAX protease family)